jgi:nucleoside-diphosphate-sugar epimerase
MIGQDSPTTLMTGATGFLGHYCLRELLLRGRNVVVVLRAPLAETSDRLAGMLRTIGMDMTEYLGRQLHLVEGSMPDRLPVSTWGQTDEILNCAASLQLFSNGNGDPFKTNVEGTKAIIQWAERNGVRKIHAVSTAYTCGWNSGEIPERFHHPKPEFQTDYERSKWLAEALLEDWGKLPGRVLTVFRPSFLVGDSQTGYTTQFAGFYQFARLVSVLKNQFSDSNGESSNNGATANGVKSANGAKTYIPLRIPGRPNDPQNIIPVDFVGRLMAEVLIHPEFHGRIYHLTNPEPPTNEQMKRCYEEYFGMHGGYFADPQEVVGKCNQAESLLWEQYDLLTPRVVHTPHFDTTNSREIMRRFGVVFPVLDQQRIFKMFDYAASSNWGRRTNGFHSK